MAVGDLSQELVDAVNRLTGRWCEHAAPRAGGGGLVLSGAGAWPPLALLLSGAQGPAAAELAAALGRPIDTARQDALSVIGAIRGGEGTDAAIGLWIRETVPLIDRWTVGLPPGVIGLLSGGPRDQLTLNQWCARETNGIIDTLPAVIDTDTLMLLVGAVVVRTRWRTPFDRSLHRGDGLWSGLMSWLQRWSDDLDEVSVCPAAGLTRFIVEGESDVDVHLILGEADARPGEVLTAALNRSLTWRPGGGLPVGHVGPGLTVEWTRRGIACDRLIAGVAPFALRSAHDLTDTPAVFGLEHASTEGDHFPAISPFPLRVQHARQDVLAGFDHLGFEGAAVTSVAAMAGGGTPATERKYKRIAVAFDRPFGFLAFSRRTGLALLAGWVSTPPPLDSLNVA